LSCRLRCHWDSRIEVAIWTDASSLFRHPSCDGNADLSILKIARDSTRALLIQIPLMVSPLNFINSSGKSNPNVSSHFCHLGLFSSLTTLMILYHVLECYTGVCPHKNYRPTVLFLATFCSPWQARRSNLRLLQSLDWMV
jgi:hypothetical protein